MSSIDDLMKTIEQANRFSHLDSLIKSIQPPQYAEISAISALAKSLQSSASLNAMLQRENQILEQLHSSHRIAEQCKSLQLAEISRQLSVPNAIKNNFEWMRTLRESISIPDSVVQTLSKQSMMLESMTASVAAIDAAKFSLPQFSHSLLAWDVASIGMINKLNDVGLFAERIKLSARLFEIPKAYSSFVQSTTKRLAENPTEDVAVRLRGSLNLAEYQLREITDTFNTFVFIPEDDEEPNEIRILNAPFVQQYEFLNASYTVDEDNTEELIKLSPTSQIVELARRVLQLVVQCNEAARVSQFGNDIFKPTTRLLEVYSEFPWICAIDKRSFRDVVDCLYFIFYEGAGKDKLRFLNEHGGTLNKDDCDLIWIIKHLRNKWSRHDPDHGNEKDIKKSWNELANKFSSLGLTTYPTDAYQFQIIHLKLLALAEDFLRLLLKNFTLRNGGGA
jgi:hypothetical protein